jgi:hypothetical protein
VVDVSLETSELLYALGDGAEVMLSDAEDNALRDLGVVVPVGWSEGADDDPTEDTQPG